MVAWLNPYVRGVNPQVVETPEEGEEVKKARAVSPGDRVESVVSGDQYVDGRDKPTGGG